MDNHSNSSRDYWNLCGQDTTKAAVVYFSQVILIYIIVCAALVNLSIGSEHTVLWIALLSANAGILLPNPTLKKRRHGPGQPVLHNTPQ